MAFDKAEPQDTTKIRNLGIVIRPNWVAIEQGEDTFRPLSVNLQNRTPDAVANDPGTLADTSKVYVKDDGDGVPEAFIKDGSGNITQVSDGGRLGGPSTDFTLNTMRFESGTIDYDVNNIVAASIRWNNAGSSLFSSGCSIAKIATGQYRVTFTTPRANTNYVPVSTPFNEGNTRLFKIGDLTTTDFIIYGYNESNSARDVGGFCHIVGGI